MSNTSYGSEEKAIMNKYKTFDPLYFFKYIDPCDMQIWQTREALDDKKKVKQW